MALPPTSASFLVKLNVLFQWGDNLLLGFLVDISLSRFLDVALFAGETDLDWVLLAESLNHFVELELEVIVLDAALDAKFLGHCLLGFCNAFYDSSPFVECHFAVIHCLDDGGGTCL